MNLLSIQYKYYSSRGGKCVNFFEKYQVLIYRQLKSFKDQRLHLEMKKKLYIQKVSIKNVGMRGQQQGLKGTSSLNLCKLLTWKYMSFIFNMMAKLIFLHFRIKKAEAVEWAEFCVLYVIPKKKK